jgi:hypothetical protein
MVVICPRFSSILYREQRMLARLVSLPDKQVWEMIGHPLPERHPGMSRLHDPRFCGNTRSMKQLLSWHGNTGIVYRQYDQLGSVF